MLELANGSVCEHTTVSINLKNCNILSSYLIIGALSVNILLGFPANCYILWLSVKEMIQGQATEIFIFDTSMADLIFYGIYFFVILPRIFNCAFCESAIIFFALLLLLGRPLFQTCICVERYLGVLHPVTFLKFKPMKYRIIISIVGWILIVCLSISATTMNAVSLYIFILPELLIFFCMKLFTCLMVLMALLRPGPGEDVKKRNRVNRDKLKAFRIILMMLLSSLLTYGPSTLSLVLYHFIDFDTFFLCWSISLSLGLMSGLVQPFLYLKKAGKLPFC